MTDLRMTPVETRSRGSAAIILLICGLLTLLDGADGQSLAIATPLIAQKLAMSSATIGLMFSCAALGSAFGYLGGGFLTDRWGARTVLVASAVLIGVFQLMTALVNDITTLIAVRFIVAVGLGGAVPGLIAIVSHVAPARLRDRILGLIWACFPLGVLSGSLLNGWILHHAGWHVIFIVGGIAPLVVALAVASMGPVATDRRHTVEAVSFARAFLANGVWARSLFTALIFFFANGATAVIMNWTPTLLARAGYAAEIGARASASGAAGALISMALTGFIVERSRVAPIILGLSAATAAALLCASFLGSLLLVTILMIFLGAALGLSGTAATFLPAALFSRAQQASGLGVGMAIGRAGQMIFPGLIGLALQRGASPTTAFALTAALPASGALAALALGFHLRRSSRIRA